VQGFRKCGKTPGMFSIFSYRAGPFSLLSSTEAYGLRESRVQRAGFSRKDIYHEKGRCLFFYRDWQD
jgi:hypothetical protein